MTSFATAEEMQAIQSLHKRTPYIIQDVTKTQFSIARFYGAISYNGESYLYNPATDELIRADVLRFIESSRRLTKKKAKAPTLSLLDQP